MVQLLASSCFTRAPGVHPAVAPVGRFRVGLHQQPHGLTGLWGCPGFFDKVYGRTLWVGFHRVTMGGPSWDPKHACVPYKRKNFKNSTTRTQGCRRQQRGKSSRNLRTNHRSALPLSVHLEFRNQRCAAEMDQWSTSIKPGLIQKGSQIQCGLPGITISQASQTWQRSLPKAIGTASASGWACPET